MADSLFGFDLSSMPVARGYYEWWAKYEKIGPVELYENRKKRMAKTKPIFNKPTSSSKSRVKIKPENLTTEIMSTVSEYVINLGSVTEEQLLQIASETVEELRVISPKYTGKSKKIRKGKYRRGWRSTSKMTAAGLKVIIHNVSSPTLTWLLENQHLNRDGDTYSKPYPHISVAAKHAEEKIDKFLEEL